MSDPNTTATRPNPRALRKLMVASLIGSSIEWYDFFIYGTAAALVFGKLFFPESSPIIGTLLAFSTFWAGFIARPIGGLVFGHVGDKIGRKAALVTCMVVVSGATFLIGCLPTSAAIGIWAPILLVTLRFLQGIGVGGQWGGVVLLLTESAMPGRKGKTGTFGQLGVPLGLILGIVAFLLVDALVPGQAFLDWGWRIPFLATALLFPVVVFIQTKVEDSPVMRELKRAAADASHHVVQAPIRQALRTQYRKILLATGLLFSSLAIFYISITGLLDYGTRELGLNRESLLTLGLISTAISAPIIFLAGSASDRIGRRPLMLLGTAILVNTGSLFWIFIAIVVGSCAWPLVYGPYAAHLSELFEPEVRYSAA